MSQLSQAARGGACLALTMGLLLGCPAEPAVPDGSGGSGVATGGETGTIPGTGGSRGTAGAGAGTPPGSGGSGGAPGTGGRAAGSGGAGTGSGGGASATGGGAPPGTGGATGTGGRAAATGGSSGATGGAAGAAGSAGSPVPPGCVLPATVGFKTDVRPFLTMSCGGGNCHVIDAQSTADKGGFDHAYDWITGGAHASSCPGTPTPMRFQVVIAVINGANPSTCSRSRKMPPPDATGTDLRAPLTACQVATLQAWLNLPLVTQMHRLDDSSPTTPYPMPPYN